MLHYSQATLSDIGRVIGEHSAPSVASNTSRGIHPDLNRARSCSQKPFPHDLRPASLFPTRRVHRSAVPSVPLPPRDAAPFLWVVTHWMTGEAMSARGGHGNEPQKEHLPRVSPRSTGTVYAYVVWMTTSSFVTSLDCYMIRVVFHWQLEVDLLLLCRCRWRHLKFKSCLGDQIMSWRSLSSGVEDVSVESHGKEKMMQSVLGRRYRIKQMLKHA
jgi:hypothetical protein